MKSIIAGKINRAVIIHNEIPNRINKPKVETPPCLAKTMLHRPEIVVNPAKAIPRPVVFVTAKAETSGFSSHL